MNQIDPTLSARARAEREQRMASDPRVSAFVAASAGSGKTKLLTDRLLRLMLNGAEPGRIQCLTFTKAAAAEMAVRLQTRLGRWVTIPDERLDADLAALDVAPSDASRKAARALFARVLDLPGGMRIGTIHAFCQSLLRRFPLEAALSPHFQLVEEQEARAALDGAREALLAGDDAAIRTVLEPLAGLTTADGFSRLLGGLARHGEALDRIAALAPETRLAAIGRAAGLRRTDEAAMLRDACRWPAEAELAAALRRAAADGSPAVRDRAAAMLSWLGLDAGLRAEHWAEWLGCLLRQDGEPRSMTTFCNKKLADAAPEIVVAVEAEQARVLAVEDDRRAIRVVRASAALLHLAVPVLRDYAARKARGGMLDYDDLIERTGKLLIDPGAAWVLYKLDGGLDHLLLDEVQDTSDPQWRIAAALTAEFYAGLGARDRERSFFAVGDPKQSIYSFQGADPAAFDRWRGHLRERAQAAGQDWRDVPLDVSFRSTAPVLALVDAVFADPQAAQGVVAGGETLAHYPDRVGQAGAVEIWPLAPPPEDPPAEPWTVPDRNLGLSSAPQRLAEAVADWIAAQLRADPALHPGDVLVLIRRRGVFDRALVRALKSRAVPVAGLDRMMLTDQPAVQDLLALLDVLLLPEDDLSLACVLTSPLGGLSDSSLMQLAMGRRGRLWDALRSRAAEDPDWAAAFAFLTALRARVDYATPHALLVEALGRLGGRARLFARLGPEAAEPVDELLAAALRHGTLYPPSLQGFLHWLRQSGAEVKRQVEESGGGEGAVRIMTVHGAKGLQARLVILPDTTALPPEDGAITWLPDPETGLQLPLWSPRRELRCAAVARARQAEQAGRIAEYNRLLYVALTRAEDRLLICGWQPRKGVPEASWYRAVERGFERLGATPCAHPGPWDGTGRRHEAGQTAPLPPVRPTASPADHATLPDWAGAAPGWQAQPPPPEPALPRPLAPSRPEGVGLGGVPGAASPLRARAADAQRFGRGRLVHTLLQHLPDLPAARWEQAALDHLARAAGEIPAPARTAVWHAVEAVLRHPDLIPLFGPDSAAELPVSGVVGGRVVSGVIDRLAVCPDRVIIADYKTNRMPPETPEGTPVPYLRQMAAYRAVLRRIYPDRPVRCVLIWTEGARAMALPDGLLDAHAPDIQMPASR